MRQIPSIPSDAQAVPYRFQPSLKRLFALWMRNHKTRKSLNGMEGHRLDDIGVDPKLAEAEGRKPFWR